MKIKGEDARWLNPETMLAVLCGHLLVASKKRRKITITAVFQVGPDDVFLREAENSKPSSTHRGVYSDTRVCHEVRAFVKSCP